MIEFEEFGSVQADDACQSIEVPIFCTKLRSVDDSGVSLAAECNQLLSAARYITHPDFVRRLTNQRSAEWKPLACCGGR